MPVSTSSRTDRSGATMIQAFSGKLPGIKGQDVVGEDPAGPRVRFTVADTKYGEKSKSLYVQRGDHHRPVNARPRSPYQHPDVPEQGGTRARSCRCACGRSKNISKPPGITLLQMTNRSSRPVLPILRWENRPSMSSREPLKSRPACMSAGTLQMFSTIS